MPESAPRPSPAPLGQGRRRRQSVEHPGCPVRRLGHESDVYPYVCERPNRWRFKNNLIKLDVGAADRYGLFFSSPHGVWRRLPDTVLRASMEGSVRRTALPECEWQERNPESVIARPLRVGGATRLAARLDTDPYPPAPLPQLAHPRRLRWRASLPLTARQRRRGRFRPSAPVHEGRHECVDLLEHFAGIADEEMVCA
jgi:hypothetical protein